MDTRHASILLVDDEVAILEVFKLVLEDEGHSVQTSETFEAARRLVQEHSYQVLISDINLEGRKGDHGCRLAELAIEFQPGIRVILMTGGAPECLPKFRTLFPIVPVLVKPFNHDALLAYVQAVLHDGAPIPRR